jgi:lysophospholipase L1-like esterase
LREKYADRLEGLNTALPLYIQLVQDLKAIATARNIPVIYALQPEVVAESGRVLSQQDTVVQRLAFEHHRDYGTLAWRYLTRKIYEALMPLSSESFRVVDLTKLGTPHSTTTSLYTDYCHLTREGNALLAARLKPVLKEILARHPLHVGRAITHPL